MFEAGTDSWRLVTSEETETQARTRVHAEYAIPLETRDSSGIAAFLRPMLTGGVHADPLAA